MSRKRIVSEELDDGSWSWQEIDLTKPQQLPNGQVTYPVRDGARETKKGMLQEFAILIGIKEGKE